MKLYLLIAYCFIVNLHANPNLERTLNKEIFLNENIIKNEQINFHSLWSKYPHGTSNNDVYDKKTSYINDGSGSFYLSHEYSLLSRNRIESKLIKIEKNKVYKIGFYMKTLFWPTPNALFSITYYDHNEKRLIQDKNAGLWSNSKINEWENCSLTIEPPYDAKYLKIKILNHDNVEKMDRAFWVDNIYLIPNIDDREEDIKRGFNGSITKIDAFGNIKIFRNNKWHPFFPLCIYNDNYRDMLVYSNQGFNCIAWASTAKVIANAVNAKSEFNPNGMMAGLHIVNYLRPKKQDRFTKKRLIATIKEIKKEKLMAHVLWYYWDNEHMYTEYKLPHDRLNLIKKLDHDNRGQRMHPIYSLNGQVGIARKYINLIDITGTYIIGSRNKTIGRKNISNKFSIMKKIEGLSIPIVIAQINLGLTAQQGVGPSMRAYIYKSIALGARGIGYWRDRSPKNPSYQDSNGIVKDKYIYGDITKQVWWADFPSIRKEIDIMLSDGLIQSSHITDWKATTKNKNITIGTREDKANMYLIIANMHHEEQVIRINIEGLTTSLNKAINYFTIKKVSDIKNNEVLITLDGYGSTVLVIE